HRVGLLDHRLAGGGSLLDVLADRAPGVEDLAHPWEPATPGAAAVFSGLSEREQDVVRAWVVRGERTVASWRQAAAAVGCEPALGEAVMRKVRRRGRQYEERAATAAAYRAARWDAVA
ncbi:hypothetical protein ACWFR4_47945, partial [Streptomyces sp. NPDC055140]